MSIIVDYLNDSDDPDGRHLSTRRRIPVVRCDCGKLVECWDSWAQSCDKCGTEYNGSGQQLAPRSQWGEETGETFLPGEPAP